MPLPLPNLDTRRWSDLVDEGRALIPRYAPAWTDHNAHDPGITLMELLAWLVEQEIYRTNRVPERHLRKFLTLAGHPLQAPRPATLPLAFTTEAAGGVELPAGFTLATSGSADNAIASIRFRLKAPLTVSPCTVRAVQSFDGSRYVDQTRAWRSSQSFPAWGEDPGPVDTGSAPDAAAALYLGLDRAPLAGSRFSLWLAFAGRSDAGERARLAEEARNWLALCRPQRPGASPADGPSAPGDAEVERLVAHHSLRTQWEFFDGAGWQPLATRDETRAFTLDGAVEFEAPAGMQASQTGAVEDTLIYIRCRLAGGRPDAAPYLRGLAVNAAPAEQLSAARSRFEVLPGGDPPAGQAPQPLQRQRLKLAFDDLGRITALAAPGSEPWPEVLVFDYAAATAEAPGFLTCALVHAGNASGLPADEMRLALAPIAAGLLEVWLLTEEGAERWNPAADLDAAGPDDPAFAFDPDSGRIRFGDGEHGRLPPRGAAVVASYDFTAASGGNVPAGARWQALGADDDWNAWITGGSLAAIVTALAAVSNPLAGRDGWQDSIAAAAGRAAEVLWAHERLVELAAGRVSLDQLERAQVLSRRAPPRATTLLDYERLALNVPGTAVARARAWAGVDAGYPCLQAPGTVTVVVVPSLPAGRPEPSEGLLQAVRRYLHRRRTLGTRLVVAGPEYVSVRVRTRVRAVARADLGRVQSDVLAALNLFLDPMRGGPEGRGWPFGRDVYRSEVLQVIDRVAGVDFVESLELLAGEDEVACGNVCLGLRFLTTPGRHEVDLA